MTRRDLEIAYLAKLAAFLLATIAASWFLSWILRGWA